jgi:hypothetical protein
MKRHPHAPDPSPQWLAMVARVAPVVARYRRGDHLGATRRVPVRRNNPPPVCPVCGRYVGQCENQPPEEAAI